MAGVEMGALELGHRFGVDAARFHEFERFANPVGDIGEFLGPWAAAHKVMCPAVDAVQIGITAAGKGAQQVEGRGTLRIALNHPLRIGGAAFGRKSDVVDIIAAIAGQFDAVLHFGIGGSRLGELPRHPPQFHGRQL